MNEDKVTTILTPLATISPSRTTMSGPISFLLKLTNKIACRRPIATPTATDLIRLSHTTQSDSGSGPLWRPWSPDGVGGGRGMKSSRLQAISVYGYTR